jgi:hypothetical protein
MMSSCFKGKTGAFGDVPGLGIPGNRGHITLFKN